jgi:hypothetical protein
MQRNEPRLGELGLADREHAAHEVHLGAAEAQRFGQAQPGRSDEVEERRVGGGPQRAGRRQATRPSVSWRANPGSRLGAGLDDLFEDANQQRIAGGTRATFIRIGQLSAHRFEQIDNMPHQPADGKARIVRRSSQLAGSGRSNFSSMMSWSARPARIASMRSGANRAGRRMPLT